MSFIRSFGFDSSFEFVIRHQAVRTLAARRRSPMKPLTIQQVRQAVGGTPLSALPKDDDAAPVTAVCTNSKQMEPGSLFIALKGGRHDAHAFLPEAAAGGAVAALVEQPPAQSLPNVHLIQVKDTRVALGKLARLVRQSLKAKV